jgi:hypothetical protein
MTSNNIWDDRCDDVRRQYYSERRYNRTERESLHRSPLELSSAITAHYVIDGEFRKKWWKIRKTTIKFIQTERNNLLSSRKWRNWNDYTWNRTIVKGIVWSREWTFFTLGEISPGIKISIFLSFTCNFFKFFQLFIIIFKLFFHL